MHGVLTAVKKITHDCIPDKIGPCPSSALRVYSLKNNDARLLATEMDTWVIRLSKADKEKSPILVKVSRKEGGHDLDLDLLATDGDAAYTGKGEISCCFDNI